MRRTLHLTSGKPDSGTEQPSASEQQRLAAVDDLSEAPTLVGSIEGSFDVIEGYHVVGWARDAEQTESAVAIDILANNRRIASGVADVFRGDLLTAGVGKGKHGFRIELPLELCDGETYEISVRAGPTGIELSPGTRPFRQSKELTGRIEGFEAGFVVGSIHTRTERETPLTVELYIDGRPAGSRETRRESGAHRFALRVPAAALDGRPHVISVQVAQPFHLVGEFAEILPKLLTSSDVLRRYLGTRIRPALLDGAATRYESLHRQLDYLAQPDSPLGPEEKVARLRQLSLAHEQLRRGFDSAVDSDVALPAFEFPQPERPLVSVVIPVHDKVQVTCTCLASLLLAPNRASFEVIVVDDGSTDDTVELPRHVKGVGFLRHEEAQGFVRSCNDGAKQARGAYVLMLNNDTEVTPGWIDELLYVFEHFAGVGLAGAQLLYPNGKLQEAGGIVWNNGDPWNYGRDGNASEPRFNYTRQVDYISGACIMLPKALWDELGGFDEHFAPAYFEDADLAFRVRDKGLKTVYTPFCRVVHFEGMSSGKSTTGGGMKRFQDVNRPKFKARWNRAFKGNGAVGRDPDLNKDRNVRFRALVIDYTTPQSDRDAGGYAAVQEMRLLQSLGFKVSFLPDNLAYLGDATETLQRSGVECVYAPFVLSVHELLEARGSEFDLVYVTRYSIAERHIEAIRRFAPQAKVLFNNADLHFLRELRAAIHAGSRELMSSALKTREDELALMRKVDLVLSYNDAEQAVILSHNLDSTRTARCPWVVELPERCPGFAEREGLAFLGGFSHGPNVEAVEYFVREVMPLVRQRLPGTVLRVYGSEVPERIRALAAADVVIGGWVRDVAEVYDNCRIFIAPLRSGAGLKGKVIGAFAHGAPCVLSRVAAEGTGVRDGEEALIADTPAQWAEALALLYRDQKAWTALQQAARRYAGSEYSFARGQKLVQGALEAVDIFAVPDESVLHAHRRQAGHWR